MIGAGRSHRHPLHDPLHTIFAQRNFETLSLKNVTYHKISTLTKYSIIFIWDWNFHGQYEAKVVLCYSFILIKVDIWCIIRKRLLSNYILIKQVFVRIYNRITREWYIEMNVFDLVFLLLLWNSQDRISQNKNYSINMISTSMISLSRSLSQYCFHPKRFSYRRRNN